MNAVQLAWVNAQVQLDQAKDIRKKAEKDYIRLHDLKSTDGSTPKLLADLDLDDPTLAQAHTDRFWHLNEELNDLLEKCRREYREAEKDLIQWGIIQLCKENKWDIAQAIQSGMGIWVYREEVLRLFFNWNTTLDERGLVAFDNPNGNISRAGI